MEIVITKSPYPMDDPTPWKYDAKGFVNWVDEVLREGYKRNNTLLTTKKSIALARELGYEVVVKE
jgi:hypothetical protein